tara:strand:+ start:204 stop:638 length:435 start_codon:yes stop_codon:yes gene_type:complete
MPKLNLQARSTHSHSVTEYHIYTINEDFFKLTKKELTDLVQVGEVLIFKSHLDEEGTLIKASDIDMYQEVLIYTEVQRQNNPQNLDITPQEALSLMTDIQIIEEDGDALEFTSAWTQEDVNDNLVIECSKELDMAMANESENIQ